MVSSEFLDHFPYFFSTRTTNKAHKNTVSFLMFSLEFLILRHDLNPVTFGNRLLGIGHTSHKTRHLNCKSEAKLVQISEGHMMQSYIGSRPLHQMKSARINQKCQRLEDDIC